MAETKHTPGQWLYDAETGEVTMADDVTALIATVQFEGTDEAQADADGYLIASAPDLLAALQALSALNDNYAPFGGEIYQDRIERAWDNARAAIARATHPANPLRGED
jgi:uncharacterized radical SAM superfamily Fe-S cluster-containing enzyme